MLSSSYDLYEEKETKNSNSEALTMLGNYQTAG